VVENGAMGKREGEGEGWDGPTRGARNDFWHSDISNVERPPLVSVLQALIVPEGAAGVASFCAAVLTGVFLYATFVLREILRGAWPGLGKGDTLFVNMATWLANTSSSSTELRRALESLTAVHSSAALARRNNAEGVGNAIVAPPPPVTHPVVRSHPVTGQRALYVNEFFTDRLCGMSEAESAPLLAQLMQEVTQPERVYRHRWRSGDVLVWDNALLMHFAELDYDVSDRRLMHRTTAAAPHAPSSVAGGVGCDEGPQQRLPLRPSFEGSAPLAPVSARALARLLQ
jgi:alpha-ketoglutarate-dependent taurine dioxygenase